MAHLCCISILFIFSILLSIFFFTIVFFKLPLLSHGRVHSHLNSPLGVGLLLHLQLDGEHLGLPASLAHCPGLGQGGQLTPLEHQFSPGELPQHQPGLALLGGAGCHAHRLGLCGVSAGLGGLLEHQGDALGLAALGERRRGINGEMDI